METIKVNVNKTMDGYTFSILPSLRDLIKRTVPGAMPVNSIFVSYDVKSNFEAYFGNLQKHILPALLGMDYEQVQNQNIQFIDTQTKKVIYPNK
ncbi:MULTISPECIES: hypothetical protein [Runella]|jgi:hypothetical protein|uniref:Uncharacterized protein n=2 Tax=Runella TaxID=105 RepID=A0A7U3ZJD4_RUNSL|nr:MULTISPECIES: hypothetical protein [Runella]AEI48304.1 hypothetical protein Runsl_1880 [Runella slithyformis DSM 19594]AXE19540.1 hypothetical protein DR864_18250 [Runella rosea]